MVIVESEGNGRMCLTLPEVLITVMGIEKVVPTWRDLEVFLQLLPRSSTGERMNPYTSTWTGVTPGDGPQEFHLVLLDNGRTRALADEARAPGAALHPLLGLPQRLPGLRAGRRPRLRLGLSRADRRDPHPAAGPAPKTDGSHHASLPYASSLCGACYEVCPVKINIPEVLVHLRGEVVRHEHEKRGGAHPQPEHVAMTALARVFANRRLYEAAQRAGRFGQWPLVREGKIERLPGALAGWTAARDLRPVARQSFRDWWREREAGS